MLEEGAFNEALSAFHEAHLEPNVTLRVHDDYSILSMIEEGIGVSIIPEMILNKVSYDVSVLPVFPELKRKIGIVTKERNTIPIASKTFIQFLLGNADMLP